MKVTVRCAEAEDAAAIAVCLAALGYGTSTTLVAEKLPALMGSSSDTVLVAEDPTTGIVGVVSVHLVPLFHAAGNLARLTALAVVPGHQRKGVGRALVAAAEAFAWQRDCRRVEVTSGDHREDAHTLYGALGYEMDERRFIKHLSSAVGRPRARMTRPVLGGISPFFVVAELDTALAFYREKLGFDVTFRGPADDPFFGIVERDQAMIMFKVVGVPPLPNSQREPGARWDAYVYTPDPDALAAEFASRGVAFSAPLKDDDDGLRGFELKDVDGYVLFFGRTRAS